MPMMPDLERRGGFFFPERIVSDGLLGAAAGSDLVLMGTVVLQPDIIDGSSPGGALSGPGTLPSAGRSSPGQRPARILGGTIQSGLHPA